jgi:hypothetical protein
MPAAASERITRTSIGTDRIRWSGFGKPGSFRRKREPNPAASTTAHLIGSGVIAAPVGRVITNPALELTRASRAAKYLFYSMTYDTNGVSRGGHSVV